jgi:seryl-tRNA synthetase
MHDIKWIRKHPDEFDRAMERRGLAPISAEILSHDKEVRGGKAELQELQQKMNEAAKNIGALKAKGEDASEAIAATQELKAKIAELKNQQDSDVAEPQNALLDDLVSTLPNILDEDVPEGAGEEDNEEIRRVGEKTAFDFEAKEHFDIGEALGMMDFEQTAKISGARFVSLSGDLARLERALAQFMLDVHTQELGFTEVSPPLLVRDDAMFGSSQLPKFSEDSFETTNGYRLIPTAEVSLVNIVRERILNGEDLPLRFTAYTPCFRSEAGSAGKDTRGMIRLHQFAKVELVSVTTPEASEAEHERITGAAEEILKRLELPYRVMKLCSKDTGFGARKTFDLEVWLPGQVNYREISSCSNCGEFQARRMNTRYRDKQDAPTAFVHTLNGSGLAVGRTMVAILENYQNADGSVRIPDALHPYMQGQTEIKPAKSIF